MIKIIIVELGQLTLSLFRLAKGIIDDWLHGPRSGCQCILMVEGEYSKYKTDHSTVGGERWQLCTPI